MRCKVNNRMTPTGGPALPLDRSPVMVPPAVISPPMAAVISPPMAAEIAAKDGIITWYQGEFAAANAIIDALCNHITQMSSSSGGGASEYEAVFAAIHRRRLNWIPVLQMQKYFSIAGVALELRKVAAAMKESGEKKVAADNKSGEEAAKEEEMEALQQEEGAKCDGNGDFSESVDDDSPHSEITDTGSQEVQITLEQLEICENHEKCGSRHELIKATKGFSVKEPVKGHMMNVVKGLKMYEDIFTDEELSKLNDFVDELRVAGQNGALLGQTYVLFNKEVKGSKREQVQLGAPIFGHIKDESSSEKQKTNIEPIPALLQSVIDHLAQWRIIPETKKPNGCIINYFDELEYSQPFFKPPHLDRIICTLLLSESTLAFGRTLLNDGEGNFKGHLMLSIKQGSVLVMRNNSADVARHAMCSSPSKRATITFYRVRPESDQSRFISQTAPLTQAMSLWQPASPMPRGWALIHAPVFTFPRKVSRDGTGVFLPWKPRPRKATRQLPPRAQKGRVLRLMSSADTGVLETMSDPGLESKAM